MFRLKFSAAGLLVISFLARELPAAAAPDSETTSTALTPNSRPHPAGPDADIWVLAGQSNMYGSASLPDKLPDPDPRIMLYNMDDTWIVAQEPLHRIFQANAPIIAWFRINDGMTTAQLAEMREKSKTKPMGSGVGPGLPFARHLEETINKPLGLIANSPGGSSMQHWSPSLKDRGGNSLYGAMMQRIAAVGGKVKGVIWYQGESETETDSVAVYEKALFNLVDSLRRDIGNPDLPIVIVQIARCTKSVDPVSDKNWETIRDIQRRVADARPNTYLVSAIDLPLTDNIHINYDAQQRLGKRIAEVVLTNVYKQPGHGDTIRLESATVTTSSKGQMKIRVRYRGVTGHLTSAGRPNGFFLRYPENPKEKPEPLRLDFDAGDPGVVIVNVKPAPRAPVQLYYAPGADPYANIVDEKDIPLPAFGPVELDLSPISADAKK